MPDKKNNEMYASIISVVALLVSICAACFNCKQNDISKETEINQLRPYIGIHVGADNLIFEAGKPLSVRFEIVNHGQTPALHTKVKVVESWEIVSSFKTEHIVVGEHTQNGPIVFNGEEANQFGMKFISPEPLKKEFVEKVKKGKIYFVITGVVNYMDVFGIKRTTHFGFRLDYPKSSWEPVESENDID